MSDKIPDEKSTDDDGGTGSQSGELGFVDFLLPAESRRDHEVSEHDQKNFLRAHEGEHLGLVKKQKDLARDRAQLKSQGKVAYEAARAAAYRGPAGGSQQAGFKQIKKLAESVQHTTIDNNMNPNVAVNNAETNSEQRENNLENQLQNQLRYTNTPKFNPRPRGPI